LFTQPQSNQRGIETAGGFSPFARRDLPQSNQRGIETLEEPLQQFEGVGLNRTSVGLKLEQEVDMQVGVHASIEPAWD